MARHTKKVKSVGRYGPRYGVKIRKQILAVDQKKDATYTCPECAYVRVKRESTGIWLCRHCGLKFAGGAFQPIIHKAK